MQSGSIIVDPPRVYTHGFVLCFHRVSDSYHFQTIEAERVILSVIILNRVIRRYLRDERVLVILFIFYRSSKSGIIINLII